MSYTRPASEIPCQCCGHDDSNDDPLFCDDVWVNDCGHQCFVIGGPFIAEDPCCPEHGIDATSERLFPTGNGPSGRRGDPT